MVSSREVSDQPKADTGGLSGNLQGALLLVLSGVGFTIYLLVNKLISDEVHWVVLSFWRAVFGMGLALPFILRIGLGSMKTRQFHLVFLRSVFGTLGMTLAIFAVSDAFDVSLAEFNAISFTRPLFVTLLAAIILRETVGLHRWGAVFAGFLGVLVMVVPGIFTFWRPGALDGLGLDTGSFVALGSAFALAGAIVLVKFLTAELSAIALLMYANILSTLLLLPFAIWVGGEISLENWGWIALMGIVGFGAQFCYISAMSVGEASFISPVDYLRLPMSSVADFFVFRVVPGVNVWIGAAIIVVSTLYIAARERIKSK
ncbi:MAG: DMT family transporter [Pseudomonadota bacterium]